MELTTEQALKIIRNLSAGIEEAREKARNLEQSRDMLMRQLDSQEGIRRAEMAAAAGVTVSRLQQIVTGGATPEREMLADDVQLEPRLYAALRDVLGDAAEQLRTDGYRVDVSA
jgi:hypothetical protein